MEITLIASELTEPGGELKVLFFWPTEQMKAHNRLETPHCPPEKWQTN